MSKPSKTVALNALSFENKTDSEKEVYQKIFGKLRRMPEDLRLRLKKFCEESKDSPKAIRDQMFYSLSSAFDVKDKKFIDSCATLNEDNINYYVKNFPCFMVRFNAENRQQLWKDVKIAASYMCSMSKAEWILFSEKLTRPLSEHEARTFALEREEECIAATNIIKDIRIQAEAKKAQEAEQGKEAEAPKSKKKYVIGTIALCALAALAGGAMKGCENVSSFIDKKVMPLLQKESRQR